MKRIISAASLLFLLSLSVITIHAEPLIKPGDRLAIIGDSVTAQGQYPRYMECYLLACTPQLDVKVFQFSRRGDNASGFAKRMETDLVFWKPTLLTNHYGMSDGLFRPYFDVLGIRYGDGTRLIHDRMKALGARVIEGGPGAVDTETYRPKTPDEDTVYNDTLKRLSDIGKAEAEKHGFVFSDHHALLLDVMEKAKAKLGQNYAVCGADGIHPGSNGQLVIAYGFLKAMGLDGNIGTITVDLKGKSEATEGHKILAEKNGAVEIESTRYPFCFADEKAPGIRSILPFVPFNEELNRYMLVVKNLDANTAKVTWGMSRRFFSRKDLESGVNLAAEFLDNPFSKPFAELDKAVDKKQNFEATMIQKMVTTLDAFRSDPQSDEELKTLLNALQDNLCRTQERYDADARALVKPVQHVIQIQPIAGR